MWAKHALCAILVTTTLGGCDAPVFLDCDGAPFVDAAGSARCGDAGPRPRDAAMEAGADGGPVDAGQDDAGLDAGWDDAGLDGGGDDAGWDAGAMDAGPMDAGPMDAGADATVDGGLDGSLDAGAPPLDTPDCLDELGCPFDIRSVLEPTAGSPVSLRERIDGADHAIPTACGTVISTDRDVIRVRAPARTLLEVTFSPDADSDFRPVVEAYDTGLASILAFDGFHSGPVRLVMISPAPSPESLHFLVAQEQAYGSLCAAPPPTYRGGPGHGYTVTASVCETCVIRELGALGSGLTATAAQHQRGQMTVYRFTAPMDATPEVSVSVDGTCPSGVTCCPIVVPLEPGGVTPATVRANYAGVTGRTCFGDTQSITHTNTTGERLFAVYDYESAGAPGYDIAVSVMP